MRQELIAALALAALASCGDGADVGEPDPLGQGGGDQLCLLLPSPDVTLLGPIPSYLDGTHSDSATVMTVGSFAGPRLAVGSELMLLIDLPYAEYGFEYPEEMAPTLEGTGTLAGLEWKMCSRRKAEALVTVRPSQLGDGSIIVRNDGKKIDTFRFVVVEPTAIDIAFQPGGKVEAKLVDASGDAVHTSDVLWQLAPSIGLPLGYGNVAHVFATEGLPEIVVTASHGQLSKSLRLRNDGRDWYAID